MSREILATAPTGSINYYDNGLSFGTSKAKGRAGAMGGHAWNPLSNETEFYYPNLRNHMHFVDDQNKATSDWWPRKKRVSLSLNPNRCYTTPTKDWRMEYVSLLEKKSARIPLVENRITKINGYFNENYCKFTKNDIFYKRPSVGNTKSGVTYNIITN
jgi:hypothetical protein